MGWRFEKKVYDGGVLTKHLRFVYDGCKLIAIHDALDGDRQVMTFVWQPERAGLDVPLAMTWNEDIRTCFCCMYKHEEQEFPFWVSIEIIKEGIVTCIG
ncbi:MAG: hypothetical protein HPZ91_00015 [Lentisphaeria bacterium]|nr:hypothetical protein [Lentisphaeria bacterium]